MQQTASPHHPGVILTRSIEQKARIGEDIIITILAISGRYVKLGFNAPKNIIILREELWRVRQQSADDPSKGS